MAPKESRVKKRHRDAPSLYKTPKRVRRLQKFLKNPKNPKISVKLILSKMRGLVKWRENCKNLPYYS
jgi:hypothetical protein